MQYVQLLTSQETQGRDKGDTTTIVKEVSQLPYEERRKSLELYNFDRRRLRDMTILENCVMVDKMKTKLLISRLLHIQAK